MAAVAEKDLLGGLKAPITGLVKGVVDGFKAGGANIVDMSVGEPQHDFPKLVAGKFVNAFSRGAHVANSRLNNLLAVVQSDATAAPDGYPPVPGTAEMRKAGARFMAEVMHTGMDENDVIVNGRGRLLLNATLAAIQPKKVAVIAGYWPTYANSVNLNGAELVEIPCHAENGFVPTIKDIRDMVHGIGVEALILNDPNNPTGAEYGDTFYQQLLQFVAHENGWRIEEGIKSLVIIDDNPYFHTQSAVPEDWKTLQARADATNWDNRDVKQNIVTIVSLSKAGFTAADGASVTATRNKELRADIINQLSTLTGGISPYVAAVVTDIFKSFSGEDFRAVGASYAQNRNTFNSIVAEDAGLTLAQLPVANAGLFQLAIIAGMGSDLLGRRMGALTNHEGTKVDDFVIQTPRDITTWFLFQDVLDARLATVPCGKAGPVEATRFNMAVTGETAERGAKILAAGINHIRNAPKLAP